MFCMLNILLAFLLSKIDSSDQLTRSLGPENYRRDELDDAPTILTNHQQLNEEDFNSLPIDHAPQQLNEENVQLITPNDVEQLNQDDQPIPEVSDEEKEGSSETEQPKKSPSLVPPLSISSHRINNVNGKGPLWPMGVVPYFIDKKIYDPTTVKRIVKQMSVIETSSCLVFRELMEKPKDSVNSWLYITNPKKERECVHQYSTSEAGGIEVVLGFDCLHPTEVLHSLLHAIGFNDEVSHPHRDQYIRVLWDNIQPKYRFLFRIQFGDVPYKLVEYDPMSIMHFHDRAFSANGAATIAALVPGLQISGSQTLSQLDIMKLKLAFGHECNKRKIGDLLDTCKHSIGHKNGKGGEKSEDGSQEKEGKNVTKEDTAESTQRLSDEGPNSSDETLNDYTAGDKAPSTDEPKVEDGTERIPNRFKSINSH